MRGKGVVAVVDGRQVLVGSRALMQDHGIDPEPFEVSMQTLEKEARTAMLVAVDTRLKGVIAVADTLKEDTASAIADLHQMGLETVMVTGDNYRTATAIARQIGIDHVLAEVLPEGKVEEVQKLQRECRTSSGLSSTTLR